jgi:hypothetical protein
VYRIYLNCNFIAGLSAVFTLQTNAARETVPVGVEGYLRVTSENPLTYPPPVQTSTLAIQTGYPKVTPENPLTYPPPVQTSTSAIQTGYPKVTPENLLTYPPPVRTYTKVIQTGYPKVTPENQFSYLLPVESSTGKNVIQDYQKRYTSSPLTYN